MRNAPLLVIALLATACSSRTAYYAEPVAYDDYSMLEQETVVVTSSTGYRARNEAARGPSAVAGLPVAAPAAAYEPAAQPQEFASADGMVDVGAAEPAPDANEVNAARLLVYTAQVTLAIYDVAATQEAALAVIEDLGGYASQRSSTYVVFRVPASEFRTALDALDDLGDVLSLDWQAADVSEEYRDIDIRLQNALEMRERLQALLDRATTVQDMLYIEQQIERLTLEIELYRGQLRSLSDQIAYSTITLSFSRVTVSDVPTNDYRLPFPWLNTLGLEQLLAM